jgi:2-keto-3-deoxy-L-rhamnonate aldolase RhmA
LPGLLKGSKPLFGMFVGIASPAIVEMCGHAGFDFVILDNEHGPASIETTEHLKRAARCVNMIPIVRTLESDILRILDIGASGIQVPQVNTAEQAAFMEVAWGMVIGRLKANLAAALAGPVPPRRPHRRKDSRGPDEC